MHWSPQQDDALLAVDRWLRGDRQLFRLFGYAGTGKTTLARHFAEQVGGPTLFCAFTGKAASVLRRKGCPGAGTIHSLIYVPKDKSRLRLAELERQLAEMLEKEKSGAPVDPARRGLLQRALEAERSNLKRPAFDLRLESDVQHADLVVVDECSMVDERMGLDLLSYGTKVLVLGDPAQLPPVANAGYFTNAEPDFMLTEVHRQARDNPVLHLATAVREERRLSPGRYGDSEIFPRGRPITDCALAADQILAGRNRTRRANNARMRELLGWCGELPNPGEKLICLRNNHELGLLNGTTWDVEVAGQGGTDRRLYLELRAQDVPGGPVALEAWVDPFLGADLDLPWWERKEAEEFDYGYTITCHKAQGSQWDRVLLIDESAAFRRDSWRWLYTGITRAAETIHIYPKDTGAISHARTAA